MNVAKVVGAVVLAVLICLGLLWFATTYTVAFRIVTFVIMIGAIAFVIYHWCFWDTKSR